jgi:hypothetical protein
MMQHKLAFAALAALCIGSAAYAESSISDVVSTLSARPMNFAGTCPAQIAFSGAITVRGNIDPRSPVQMGYTFLRSDGATGPVMYYNITAPGTQTVNTTWTLGGPQLPNYDGWMQLKAWPTRHLGFGTAVSPRATFHVSCSGAAGGGAASAPHLNLSAALVPVPATYNGTCPAVITFRGQIIVTGALSAPMEVGYTFLRSDNAAGPVQYLNVTHPGAYPVEDNWAMGGPQLPRFEGWQQLKTWPTHHDGGIGYVFSPRAEFRMSCR